MMALTTKKARGAMRVALLYSLGCLVIASLTLAPLARAQSTASAPTSGPEEGTQLAEITVTAQKRAERAQDVPISDSTVSANEALSRGITDVTSLQMAVPGLVIDHTANEGNIFIRGVGTNLFGPSSEQTVAMYVDNVYMPSPEANLFSFNNIDRVEVLKGPQGTLFGRNTTGGVVQVITKDPSTTFGGDMSIGYANYDTVSSQAYLTGGVLPDLAADIAVMYENQGIGWGHNFTTDRENGIEAKDSYALRSKWKFTPSESTTIRLILDYSRQYTNYDYQIIPGVHSAVDPAITYPGPYNALGDLNDFELEREKGASIQLEQDAQIFRIVNILSYRHTEVGYFLDQDDTPVVAADLDLPSIAHDWTEELQIHSLDSSRIKWLLGGFFYDAYAAYTPVNIDDGAVVISDYQKTRSPAGFGQATIPLIADTNFTAGARYTSEHQSFSGTTFVGPTDLGTYPSSQTFSKTTWRLAFDHHFTSDVMAYLSANRGFKSGGYNMITVAGTDSFLPETLDAYELGIKSEMLDHRVRVNAAAFWYNYSNIQIEVPVTGGTTTVNGPKARIKGLEGQIDAKPIEPLTLSAGVTLLDGKYTNYPAALAIGSEGQSSVVDATGHYIVGAPKATGNISAAYLIRLPTGKLEPNLSIRYDDGYFFYADNRLSQPSYTVVNATLTWYSLDDRWSLQAWGKNLNNALYYEGRSEQGGLGDAQRQAPPRTYGVSFRVKF
jgi:iron complex outermembrane receptor protein